jgi:hypothetical protein
LSTPDADELGKTAPLELPKQPPPPASSPNVEPPVEDGELPTADQPVVESVAAPPREDVVYRENVVYREPREDVTYVPLAITIGDGFKFGCGFFLALVLVMLVGFVLLAALFLLTSLFGLNLPITR